MNVSNSQMHLLTFIFLILELMMFCFQLWYYCSWPQDRNRLWYLILLGLLIFYNITGGLFPDEHIDLLSVRWQNIIAYGSGFLMASYFPFYFYKSFDLELLRFHALYGVPFFFIFPYIGFFVVMYAVNGNLDHAVNYGMVIPFLYSIVVLWSITKAIWAKSKSIEADDDITRYEMLSVYFAVLPWILMSIFSVFHVTQWIEVLCTNLGFILITVLFMIRASKNARMEREKLLFFTREQQDVFNMSCEHYNLTKREIEVAALLCRGLTYIAIAELLFISRSTVDTHVQHIFEKTAINTKIELQQKLGYSNQTLV